MSNIGACCEARTKCWQAHCTCAPFSSSCSAACSSAAAAWVSMEARAALPRHMRPPLGLPPPPLMVPDSLIISPWTTQHSVHNCLAQQGSALLCAAHSGGKILTKVRHFPSVRLNLLCIQAYEPRQTVQLYCKARSHEVWPRL